MKLLVFLVLSSMAFWPAPAFVQSLVKKPKVSFSKGTIFGYYGYNRSWYGNSTINFNGPGYSFSLKGSKAEDNPFSVDPGQQLNPLRATTGQYNVRLGYHIKDHWAISVGYDKLKYVLRDSDQVLLSGQIEPGVDMISNWSGNYTNTPTKLYHSKFLYSNSGLNYVRVELSRADQWLAAGRYQQIIFSTIAGIGFGGLVSDNSFLFAGKQEPKLRSFSGFALSGHVGVRLEFFKHLFIQSNFSGGYMNQTHIRTNSIELNSFAEQRFGYLQFDTNVGFFLYIRPADECNTCPKW